MGWQTVFICDAHWEEQEGKRLPVRLIPDGVEVVTEPCYLCHQDACIPVRRQVESEGRAACGHCREEGVVRVNGTWLCLSHLDVGFHDALGPVREAFGVTPDGAA